VRIVLVRHGETEWSRSGQHTSRTDLPLIEEGRERAVALGPILSSWEFSLVLTSPLRRARETCELAGYGDRAVVCDDLREWDYGEYEGRLRVDILKERPDWELFRDGCPGGESPQQVAARADRVVSRVRSVTGNVLLFSSGHFLRMLATRWIGIEPINGQSLMLGTASLSAVGYENSLTYPAIRLWNDTHHVLASTGQDAATRVHASATS